MSHYNCLCFLSFHLWIELFCWLVRYWWVGDLLWDIPVTQREIDLTQKSMRDFLTTSLFSGKAIRPWRSSSAWVVILCNLKVNQDVVKTKYHQLSGPYLDNKGYNNYTNCTYSGCLWTNQMFCVERANAAWMQHELRVCLQKRQFQWLQMQLQCLHVVTESPTQFSQQVAGFEHQLVRIISTHYTDCHLHKLTPEKWFMQNSELVKFSVHSCHLDS